MSAQLTKAQTASLALYVLRLLLLHDLNCRYSVHASFECKSLPAKQSKLTGNNLCKSKADSLLQLHLLLPAYQLTLHDIYIRPLRHATTCTRVITCMDSFSLRGRYMRRSSTRGDFFSLMIYRELLLCVRCILLQKNTLGMFFIE